jgi:hypothetical protein
MKLPGLVLPRGRAAFVLYELENVNSTVSVDSFASGSYFHSFTVSLTDFTNIGLPPITLVAVTLPSAATVTCSFTLPSMCSCLARLGYTGSVRLLIGRFETSVTIDTGFCARIGRRAPLSPHSSAKTKMLPSGRRLSEARPPNKLEFD